MEIEFSHVSFYESKDKDYKKLNDASFLIESNVINAIVTNYDTGITELLSLDKRPSIGSIRLNDLIIKKNNKIEDKSKYSKMIGFIRHYTRNTFLGKTVKEEMLITLKNYNIKRSVDKVIAESFKIVGLNESILNQDPNTLSSTQKNKLSFAIALSYNPKVLIFDNFELGLTYKEKEIFKRLIRVLKIKYNKTIVLISDNVDFLKSIVDKYIVINKGSNVVETNSCYNDDMYDYTDMPQLVEFVKYCRSENHDIEEYVDIKELIKGIYRDVA